MSRSKPIVAIDGPSGAGKSTVSKLVARELGYVHINTGALYRTVALAAQRAGIAWDDEGALGALIGTLDISLQPDGRVLLDDEDVSEAIRAPDISMGASAVSALGAVRQGLLELQRQLGGQGGSVLEGRDIGTVVFPDAEVKIFLDATPEVRARRRYDELVGKGVEVDFDELLADVIRRDKDDSERALAPLKPAEDAVHVDSTDLSIEAVVERITSLARAAEGA